MDQLNQGKIPVGTEGRRGGQGDPLLGPPPRLGGASPTYEWPLDLRSTASWRI